MLADSRIAGDSGVDSAEVDLEAFGKIMIARCHQFDIVWSLFKYLSKAHVRLYQRRFSD